jgi:hypothetical protein
MDKKVQQNLERAGYRFMDAEDFLGLSDEERQIVELRMAIRREIRLGRKRNNLTQQQLAVKIKSSQPRVAKMEAGAPDVSLDLLFRGFFAAGCKINDLMRRKPGPKKKTQPYTKASKAKKKPVKV